MIAEEFGIVFLSMLLSCLDGFIVWRGFSRRAGRSQASLSGGAVLPMMPLWFSNADYMAVNVTCFGLRA